MLGVDHDGLSELALASRPGAGGVVLLPYLDGERTPNRPDATGVFAGLTSTTGRDDIARACVEGLLCALADAVQAVERVAGQEAQRILLIGGGARSVAVRKLAPAVFGRSVAVPPPGEYVALGAARQAAWALSGETDPPMWRMGNVETYEAKDEPTVLERYLTLKERTAQW